MRGVGGSEELSRFLNWFGSIVLSAVRTVALILRGGGGLYCATSFPIPPFCFSGCLRS